MASKSYQMQFLIVIWSMITGLLNSKPKYAFVNYADPSLGIEWENLAEAEVSEADKNHPLLKDVKPLKKEDL